MDHVRVSLLVLVAGCAGDPTFRCTEDAQCTLDGVAGTCEVTGYCSVPDASCDGRRYVSSAGDGLGGECVRDTVFGETPDASVQGVTTDTELSSTSPTQNFGSLDNLTVDAMEIVSLLRFELSALPAGTIVERAELVMHVEETGNLSVEVFALTEAWDELAATWSERQAGVAWSQPGAGAASREAAVLGTFSAAQLGPVTAVLDPATVQAWITDPGRNYGMVLATRSAEGATVGSSQAASAERPYLAITSH